MAVEKNQIDAVTFLVGEGVSVVLDSLSREEEFKKLNLEITSKVVLEFILFFLHFCDREIFCFAGSDKKSIIMDGVLENVFKCLEKYDENMLINNFGEKTNANLSKYFVYLSTMALSTGFRNTYNERQIEYAAYKKFFPEKDESPRDTLVWEFVKKVVVLVKGTPNLIIIMTMLSSNVIKACIKTLKLIFKVKE